MEDFHRRWPHRLPLKKISVKKSKIHGVGTFSEEKIRKNEIVIVVGGVIVPTAEIKQYSKKFGNYVGIRVNEKFSICPTTRKELLSSGVYNHSCDPNLGLIDQITLIAIKDIEKGEELVTDYAFYESVNPSYEKNLVNKCNCGSKNCRKVITINDWKIKSIQRKYGRYFSPYLKARIK